MEKQTVTTSIRDALVMKCIQDIALVTSDDTEVAIHAALVLFVVQELTGLDDIDDLREQMSDVTSRIIDKMEQQ